MILDLLTLGALRPPKMVHWLVRTLAGEAEREQLDEGGVRGELLELQQRLDAGEIDEADYDRQEEALLERMTAIRELIKARQGTQA